MPWSIFSKGQGGGPGAALTWAEDLLRRIGAPETAGNKQFVYDWEVSEGGGGAYNPLNQGPVPGDPRLTTSGSQYGGGAADYASWTDGLTGAADYLNMSSYQPVAADLQANDPAAARTALWDSPWAASHYGYGSAWSSEPVPGRAQALPAGGGGKGSGKGSSGGVTWYEPWTWAGAAASALPQALGDATVSAAEAPFKVVGDAIVASELSAQNFALHYGAVLLGLLAGAGLVVAGVLRATAAPRQDIMAANPVTRIQHEAGPALAAAAG